MQLRRFLLLGMLLGAEATQLVARQNTNSDSAAAPSTDSSPASTAEADPTSDSAATTAAEPTTAAQPTDDSSTADGSTTDGSSDGGSTTAEDVTVTKTVTVTDANAKTVSRQTTVMKTITSTVVVTSTAFDTKTVTSSDAETATTTTYVTSTKWANEKRALDLAPRTIGGVELVAPALPTYTTTTSAPPHFNAQIEGEHYGLRAFRRGLHKRATTTTTVTVTEGGGDSDTTVFNTVSRTVISTVSSQTKITKTITETEQAGAKAGIGAGVGVAGLAIIAGLLWFCLRKRRNAKNKAEYDDVFGASEVPVGGRGGGGAAAAAGTSPHMSQTTAAASTLAPSRNTTKSEGYRGTALGDGRAGFAKPQQFGRSYMPVSPETNYSRTAGSDQAYSATTPENNYAHPVGGSPNHNAAEMYSPANTAELASDSAATKWHQNDAAEIDGNQVSSARGTAPPENVYEMPAQPYR
ncbi:hypothetical protein FOC1_g10009637 [Fusarium oxysporum f. sp. cubense race 1]|uniref:Mid2 domain-containing protein n=1 Tax=Fusarium oxysporum f. sp. cubense (strain race 1) TaxID=1229664 RepID=N4UCE9_FUSC1|nr:hypothetical protein FOC1_g10009637 [Fusarium oxysporum f. sp. cubense race 1]